MSGDRASARDDWRPGFARRSATFEDEVLPTARTWRWEAGVSWWRVRDAINDGGSWGLTRGEKDMLLLYVGRVNQERLEQSSDACVWPGAGWLSRRLECDERTVRRLRQGLEAKGWIVRDFNVANRPNGENAVNLAPTFARLEEMEARIRALDEDLDAYREAYAASALPAPEERQGAQLQAPQAVEREDKDVRPGGQKCPPKQSQTNDCWTVQGRAQGARPENAQASPSDAGRFECGPRPVPPDRPAGEAGDGARGPAEPRDPGRARLARGASAVCSPRRAGGRAAAPPAGSVLAERLREELQLARQASPRLAALVPAHVFDDPASARAIDAGMVARAAEQLLPEGARNNGLTVIWGWERHGPRVVAMLAAALEAPKAENRCRYFGAFVKADGAKLDLRMNLLQAVRRQAQGGPAAPAEAPSPDPVWAAIAARIRQRVGEGAWGSWFGEVEFRGLEDQVLMLTVKTRLARDKISERYGSAIRAAARDAGHIVLKLAITARPLGPSTR